jgi:hypothetical protein
MSPTSFDLPKASEARGCFGLKQLQIAIAFKWKRKKREATKCSDVFMFSTIRAIPAWNWQDSQRQNESNACEKLPNTRQHHNSSNECEKWPRLTTQQIEHCLRKSAKTGNITIGAIPARNLPRLLETSQVIPAIPARNLPRLLETSQVIPAMPSWNCKKVRNSKKKMRG